MWLKQLNLSGFTSVSIKRSDLVITISCLGLKPKASVETLAADLCPLATSGAGGRGSAPGDDVGFLAGARLSKAINHYFDGSMVMILM